MADVVRVNLLNTFGRRTVRRWEFRATDHPGAHNVQVAVGWLPDGRWWVWRDPGPHGLIYSGDGAERAAYGKAEVLMDASREHPGAWVEVIAEHQPEVAPRAVDVPPKPPTAMG
jgi:hypothetical protein